MLKTTLPLGTSVGLRLPRSRWAIAAALYALLFLRLGTLGGFPSVPSVSSVSSALPSVPVEARLPSDASLSPVLFGRADVLYKGGFDRFAGADVAVATLILEAVGDGFDAMTAVGEVIRNRAAQSGKKYGEVCLAPYQFSAWNDPARARAFLNEHAAHYEAAFRAWIASAESNLTRGATHYHADYVSPSWADAMRRSAKIGRHIFYRES